MNPLAWARAVVRDAKRDVSGRISAVVALFAVLVAIALVRRGGLPDERGAAAIAGAAIVIVMLAQLLPEPMTLLLAVAVVVTVVQDGGATLTALVDRGVAEFRRAIESVGVS